jgi:flagellar basal-body rod modification protein FlgD
VNEENAMTVNATSPVGSPAPSTGSSTASAATQTLGYNDFLTLLMAEMKNQDPTQPMDPSQMVSQLATVSEVGQSVQANSTLASLLTATSLSQAEQLIGRTVTSADGSTSGEVASVSVTSTGAVATLTNGGTVSLANGASVQ